MSSLRRVYRRRPALAIDFQGLIQSAVIGRIARPKEFWGFDRSIAREPLASFFYSRRIVATGRHRIERNLELATAAGATRTMAQAFIPSGRPEGQLPNEPFVLAAPFAGWASKQWPIEHYHALSTLLDKEGIPLVLAVGPGQTDGLDGFHLHTSSLAGLVDATRRAAAVVGVDSGPLHLAAALGKPGVGIYGPTDPEANGPYGGTIEVIRHPDARTTYKRHDAIHPAMRAVTAEEVFLRLIRQLTLAAGRAS
jgi:heptosyltransferase-1